MTLAFRRLLLLLLLLVGSDQAFAGCTTNGAYSAACTTSSEARAFVQTHLPPPSNYQWYCSNRDPQYGPPLDDFESGLGGDKTYRVYFQCGRPGTYGDEYAAVNSASYEIIDPSDFGAAAGKNKGDSCDCDKPVTMDEPVGDPINAATGSKYLIRTEYLGPGPFPLQFTVAYNGRDSTYNGYGGQPGNPADNLMGINRIHNYAISVEVNPNGSANVYRPDGSWEKFTKSGSMWLAQADNAATLIQTVDGQGVTTGWEHHRVDGTVEYFRSDGLLTKLVNRAGLTQTLTYSATTGLLSSVTDPNGRSLGFSYDANYLLTRLDLPDGQHLEFTYDSTWIYLANLTSVKYPDGSTISYKYNEPGYVTLDAPLTTYDPHALTGIVDEKGNRYSSTKFFDSNLGKIANVDYRGDALNLDHFDLSYQIMSTNPYTTTTTIAGPLGGSDTRAYKEVLGRMLLTSRTLRGSGITKTATYTYDAQGRPDIFADFAGTTTDYDYDAVSGLLTQEIDSANVAASKRTIQTHWNTTWRLPDERWVYDSSAAWPGTLKWHEQWTFNSRGQVLTHIRIGANNPSVTRTTTYAYCDSVGAGCPLIGLLKQIDGERGDVSDTTTFSYYASTDACVPATCRIGDLKTVTNAKGQITTYNSYDGAGRPLQITDANGVVTDFTYTSRGWLTQVAVRGADPNSTGDDAITNIAYEPTGVVSKITQPDGDYLSYTYDDAHRLTDVTDNLGRSLHYTLDAAGNRIREDSKNSSGVVKHTMAQVYDQLGRIQKSLNASGLDSQATMYGYDLNDNPVVVSDPLHTATQIFDKLDRPTVSTQDAGDQSQGHLNVQTQVQYNALDEVTQITDPKSLNTTYTYNGFGDLISQSSPDTGTTNYTVLPNGLRWTQTDARGITTTYLYDALNRPTTISYPTAAPVAYTYDTANAICASGETYAKGHLTKFTDSTGNTQFCYDRFGNLTRKVQVNGTLTQTTRYEYTLGGRLYRVTYPSGAQALYTRNTSGQISSVQLTIGGATSTLISSVNYMPFGPFNVLAFGNGRVQTRGYDLDYNPSLAYDSSTDGFNVGFSVDAIGNIASAGETFKGVGTTRNYSYDGLNRLSLATTPSATTLDERFTYDGTDRQSKQIGATGTVWPYVYPSNSHRLSSMFGQPRSYDAAGNLTAVGTPGTGFDYVYDDRGRMTGLKFTGNTVRTYNYNGRGERVVKTDLATPANSLMFAYDEAGHLLGEYTTAGVPVAEYVWMDDTLVGIIKAQDGTTFQYVETDYLGTPRVVIKPTTNTAVWHWDLTSRAFGETAPNADPDGNGVSYTLNLRYPGQYYDDLGGMNYNYYRDYEPGTGRYAESDPIGLGGGISTYGYTRGNPLSRTDAVGLSDYLKFDGSYLRGYTHAWRNQNGLPTSGPIDGGAGDANIYYAPVEDFSAPAQSGPWGLGALPEGYYAGSNLRVRDQPAMMCPNGDSWSLDLPDKGGRSLLRIHPDSPKPPGTLGCIGVKCSHERMVYEELETMVKKNPIVPVYVEYKK